jgi:plasmid rolling circle replication initiator protein Rep
VFNNSITEIKKQGEILGEVLRDVSRTGREFPWREKKLANEQLALLYDEFDSEKAYRLRECASILVFNELEDGTLKLKNMNSCRLRLCFPCVARRSKKIFCHTEKIIASMSSERKYAYIFLTLTLKNCKGEELGKTLDEMFSAWHRFMGYNSVKTAIKGWYRGLEITHNVDATSESYNTYHPHFHCLLAVNKRYFVTEEYINHAEWTSLWQRAMKLDYCPQVNIKKVRGNDARADARAIAETAKYAVKSEDYIIPNNWELSAETVELLDEVLHKRRLVAYGGVMKEWHKKLNLDDEVDGDLIHISDEISARETGEEVSFFWDTGYKQYIRI